MKYVKRSTSRDFKLSPTKLDQMGQQDSSSDDEKEKEKGKVCIESFLSTSVLFEQVTLRVVYETLFSRPSRLPSPTPLVSIACIIRLGDGIIKRCN